MIGYDCDEVRDLLPAHARGELLPHETAALDGHLVHCARCRDEAEVVHMLQDALAPVPHHLEERVLSAVRTVRPRRVLRPRLALAATLAAAVAGGALLFARPGEPVAETAAVDARTLSWAAAEDPLLHGRSELQQLSVEELETLVAELER